MQKKSTRKNGEMGVGLEKRLEGEVRVSISLCLHICSSCLRIRRDECAGWGMRTIHWYNAGCNEVRVNG